MDGLYSSRVGSMLADSSQLHGLWAGRGHEPIALRGAPKAGGGDMGYLELPGRELGAFIDRIDGDKRA